MRHVRVVRQNGERGQTGGWAGSAGVEQARGSGHHPDTRTGAIRSVPDHHAAAGRAAHHVLSLRLRRVHLHYGQDTQQVNQTPNYVYSFVSRSNCLNYPG